MRTEHDDKAIEKYLSRLDHYLVHMSVSEKTDILSELKNSFYERMRDGETAESIIDEMEPPKELAMGYLGESMVQDKGFSWRNFMRSLCFYSYASLLWVSIIPTLAILSVSFFFSAGVSVLAGIMGLLKGIVHISLIDNVKLVFFVKELTGFPALLAGLLLAIIFIVLGVLCWKGTIRLVQFLQDQKWKMELSR